MKMEPEVGAKQTVDHLDQGSGFAASVRSEQADDVSALNGEVNMVDGGFCCRNIWSDLLHSNKVLIVFSFHRLIHERQDFIVLKAELPHLC